jgi:regulator of protease activity HflC (stomatin/prohibitin superfamily)
MGAVLRLDGPGLHFKIPFVDSIHKISVQAHVLSGPFQAMDTYSQDQQPAVLRLSVNYRVTDPLEVYTNYVDIPNMLSRLIIPRVNEETKTVFGQFNAVAAIQERARLNAEVTQAIQNSVVGPLIIESVQIENIDFSDAYEQSIEQRMLAEVEVQRIRQNAEREAVQAEIVVIQANAEADAIRARGDAEAAAIEARGSALQNNPLLIELTQAEKWNGILPTTMPPNGTVPFLNVAQ